MDSSTTQDGITAPLSDREIARFQARILARGEELYRDLPWRNTRDPYGILVSEVMLQQTQVARVLERWPQWLETFPTLSVLASVPLAAVLEAWQGLGYNRRAIALKSCAEKCETQYAGELPSETRALVELPGIGPATAAGVRAFAFGLPGVYLETNVRTVFLHEFFFGAEGVPDKELIPIIEATCDTSDPRRWYYALLDYGAHLKKTMVNPSRRSAHHTRQSRFEGSRRQKRAYLLREVMALPGCSTSELADSLSRFETEHGRERVEDAVVEGILEALSQEGFIVCDEKKRWSIP